MAGSRWTLCLRLNQYVPGVILSCLFYSQLPVSPPQDTVLHSDRHQETPGLWVTLFSQGQFCQLRGGGGRRAALPWSLRSVESSHTLMEIAPRGNYVQLHPGGWWEELVQPAEETRSHGQSHMAVIPHQVDKFSKPVHCLAIEPLFQLISHNQQQHQ